MPPRFFRFLIRGVGISPDPRRTEAASLSRAWNDGGVSEMTVGVFGMTADGCARYGVGPPRWMNCGSGRGLPSVPLQGMLCPKPSLQEEDERGSSIHLD